MRFTWANGVVSNVAIRLTWGWPQMCHTWWRTWRDSVHLALIWCLLDRRSASTLRCPGMWWGTKVMCLLSAHLKCTVWLMVQDHDHSGWRPDSWSGLRLWCCLSSLLWLCWWPEGERVEVQGGLLGAPDWGHVPKVWWEVRWAPPTLSGSIGEELELRKGWSGTPCSRLWGDIFCVCRQSTKTKGSIVYFPVYSVKVQVTRCQLD